MSMVLVVNHERRPCAPVHPGRARHLLTRGRAAVYRRYPFTIILTAGERAEDGRPTAAQDRPGQQDHGARRGQRCDRPGGVGRRARASGRAGESPTRSAPGLSSQPPPASHALPSRHGFSIGVVVLAGCRPRWSARISNVLTWVHRLRRWCPVGALSASSS